MSPHSKSPDPLTQRHLLERLVVTYTFPRSFRIMIRSIPSKAIETTDINLLQVEAKGTDWLRDVTDYSICKI